MSATERVAAIRARLAAATPVPWVVGQSPAPGEVFFGTLFDPDAHDEPGVLLGSVCTDNDAELIANAPADLAWLLEENARLSAQVAELRKGPAPFIDVNPLSSFELADMLERIGSAKFEVTE